MSRNRAIFHSIKSEIKDTLSVGVPLITSQLVYACSGFIGTAFVANLGKDALAASVLVNMIWASLSVMFFGILNAISVLVSHQYGAKNYQTIRTIMGQSLILGLVITVVMAIILSQMPFFLRFTSQPPTVLKLAIDYMHSLMWTLPSLVILVIWEQFLTGINHAKFVLRISLLIVPIETLLIYFFIFGKFGFPRFGVAGIGYGFATTYTLTAIFLTPYLVKAKNYRKFGIISELNIIKLSWIKELLRIGLPIGCMHVIEVSTFAVTTFWIAQFGTTILAAHQIVFQYLGFAITIVFAMSQAVTVRVGYAVGKQDLTGVHYAIYVGMMLNFVCMLIVAIAFYLFPEFFLRLDINIHAPANSSLVHTASVLLEISGILMLFDNFRIIGFGALRGLKDTKFSMYASFISFWIIGLGSAYLLAFPWQFQGTGIWWGLSFGIACGAFIVIARIQYLLKRVDLNKLMTISE